MYRERPLTFRRSRFGDRKLYQIPARQTIM